MKKLISLFTLIMVATNIFAKSFVQNGICYSITSTGDPMTVTVIYNPEADPSFSTIIIPNTVTYEDRTYSVTAIGERAFYNLPLSDVTIPESVTSIGSKAFERCTNLRNVTFKGSACQNAIANDAFNNVGVNPKPANLTLPNDWENAYLPINETTAWHGGLFRSNRYQLSVEKYKLVVIEEIRAVINAYTGRGNDYLHSIVDSDISDIYYASSNSTIESLKKEAYKKLQPVLDAFSDVYAQGKASALGTMGTEQAGPAMKVTKGGATITLYGPDKAEFIKINNEE